MKRSRLANRSWTFAEMSLHRLSRSRWVHRGKGFTIALCSVFACFRVAGTLAGSVRGEGQLRLTNKNARSRPHFHQTFHFERNNGFANRSAGNLQLLSQLPLGRQFCPKGILAIFNMRLNLQHNFLVEAPGLNEFSNATLGPAP